MRNRDRHPEEQLLEVEDSLSHARARARLARALDDLSAEWQQSWTFPVRVAMRRAHPWLATGLVASAIVLAVLAARGSGDRSGPAAPGAAGWLPIASMTPGDVVITSAAELCAGARPPRTVTSHVRDRILRGYRMQHLRQEDYELDALITPELGGSTDPRNLWPQRYDSPVWNARVKDALESLLPGLVCRGQVDLAQAQRDIAADWVAAYKKYFNTTAPLRAHLDAADTDDDDIRVIPVLYASARRD
jgi:hypothetical protein